ncbi:hypothetical protein DRP07_07155 [Archaeoglobales archaeon]|nr:MAG: hypothetical protein DRP07_07155 [Archaeoglobales archaeon]
MHNIKGDKNESKQSNIWGYITIAGIVIAGLYYLYTDSSLRGNILIFSFVLCGVILGVIVLISKLLGKAKEWHIEMEGKERRRLWATGPLAPVFNALFIVFLGTLGAGIIIYKGVAEWLVSYLIFLGIFWGIILLIDKLGNKWKQKKSQGDHQ